MTMNEKMKKLWLWMNYNIVMELTKEFYLELCFVFWKRNVYAFRQSRRQYLCEKGYQKKSDIFVIRCVLCKTNFS